MGKRAVGGAQARRIHSVLVHAHFSLHLDAVGYSRLFGIDERRIKDALSALPWRSDERARLMNMVGETISRALCLTPHWNSPSTSSSPMTGPPSSSSVFQDALDQANGEPGITRYIETRGSSTHRGTGGE